MAKMVLYCLRVAKKSPSSMYLNNFGPFKFTKIILIFVSQTFIELYEKKEISGNSHLECSFCYFIFSS